MMRGVFFQFLGKSSTATSPSLSPSVFPKLVKKKIQLGYAHNSRSFVETLNASFYNSFSTESANQAESHFFSRTHSNFESLGLNSEIVSSLKKIGIESPSQLQADSIPLLVEGKSSVLTAETGSGKTYAYLLPIIQQLRRQNKELGILHNLKDGERIKNVRKLSPQTQALLSLDDSFPWPQRVHGLIVCPNLFLCKQVLAVIEKLKDKDGAPLASGAIVKSTVPPPPQIPDFILGTPKGLADFLKFSAGGGYGWTFTEEGFQSSFMHVVFDETDSLFSDTYLKWVDNLLKPLVRAERERVCYQVVKEVNLPGGYEAFSDIPTALQKAALRGGVPRLMRYGFDPKKPFDVPAYLTPRTQATPISDKGREGVIKADEAGKADDGLSCHHNPQKAQQGQGYPQTQQEVAASENGGAARDGSGGDLNNGGGDGLRNNSDNVSSDYNIFDLINNSKMMNAKKNSSNSNNGGYEEGDGVVAKGSDGSNPDGLRNNHKGNQTNSRSKDLVGRGDLLLINRPGSLQEPPEPVLSPEAEAFLKSRRFGPYWTRQYVFSTATMSASLEEDVGTMIQRRFPDAVWVKSQLAHHLVPHVEHEWVEADADEDWSNRLVQAICEDPGYRSGDSRTLVFVSDGPSADRVSRLLVRHRVRHVLFHRGMASGEDAASLDAFLSSDNGVMVCTDAIARGFDIPNVGHIVQADFSKNTVQFIHRVGRTGRAGATGRVTSLYRLRDYALVQVIRHHIANGLPLDAAFSRGRSFGRTIKKNEGVYYPRGKLGDPNYESYKVKVF